MCRTRRSGAALTVRTVSTPNPPDEAASQVVSRRRQASPRSRRWTARRRGIGCAGTWRSCSAFHAKRASLPPGTRRPLWTTCERLERDRRLLLRANSRSEAPPPLLQATGSMLLPRQLREAVRTSVLKLVRSPRPVRSLAGGQGLRLRRRPGGTGCCPARMANGEEKRDTVADAGPDPRLESVDLLMETWRHHADTWAERVPDCRGPRGCGGDGGRRPGNARRQRGRGAEARPRPARRLRSRC